MEGSGAEEYSVPTQGFTGSLWPLRGNSVEVKRRSWETRAEGIALRVVTMQASRGWVLGVF